MEVESMSNDVTRKLTLKGLDSEWLECMKNTLGTKPREPARSWEKPDFDQAFLHCIDKIGNDVFALRYNWKPSPELVNRARQLWKHQPTNEPRPGEYFHKLTTQTNQVWTQTDLDRECQLKYGPSWVWDSELKMCVDTTLPSETKKHIIKFKI